MHPLFPDTQFCGLVLLTALLLTPARRHPIVNSIVVLSIAYCIIGAIPPFLWLVSSASRAALSDLASHKRWQLFCLADAILLVPTFYVNGGGLTSTRKSKLFYHRQVGLRREFHTGGSSVISRD